MTDSPDLLAWIGEDEMGSGVVGIKQAVVPAGYVPIVAIESHKHKITGDLLIGSLQAQSNVYRKTIRLVRYTAVEEVIVITPAKQDG